MFISWLDTGLVVVLAYHALQGLSLGGIFALRRMVYSGLILLALFAAAPWVATRLIPVLPWPTPLITLALMLVFSFFLAAFWHRIPHFSVPEPFRPLDRLAGLLLGGAWGFVWMTLFAWGWSAMLGTFPAHSPVAQAVLKFGEKPLETLTGHLPTGLPNVVISREGWELVSWATQKKIPPSQLEKEMLGLVNQARKDAKVSALSWNGGLAQVARLHSQDMLKKNYFAHEDPQGHTVAYRVSKAGIPYLMVGENLAYAPDLAIAHNGLMRSPGHRENILRPSFREVGIGIVRVPDQKHYQPHPLKLPGRSGYLLVTQVFRR